MFLQRICSALDNAKIPYAIVGGYAVALHGCVRGTVDIDFVTNLDFKSLTSLEASLQKLGLVSRLPIHAKDVAHFRDEYIKKRNLIAWNFYNPINPLESVDVLLTYHLNDLETVVKKVGQQKIVIVSIKDLITMKKASGRKQDLEDVKALESLI